MKRILVLSDSHREISDMKRAVKIVRPDLIFHLGDHYGDAMKLKKMFPGIPLEAVAGNCDYGTGELEKLVTVEDKKIFLCHGHRYRVKSGYLALEYAAREKEADVVLFGHTHLSYLDENDGLFMMNPGSIGIPRDPGGPTYGLLVINKGQVHMSIMTLRDEWA